MQESKSRALPLGYTPIFGTGEKMAAGLGLELRTSRVRTERTAIVLSGNINFPGNDGIADHLFPLMFDCRYLFSIKFRNLSVLVIILGSFWTSLLPHSVRSLTLT